MSKDGIKEINPINIDTKGTNINYSGASRKLSGKAALKKTIKEIKKTPNKNFKQEGVVGGKEQKNKAIQQQKDTYNKQKEDYKSPFSFAKGGLVKKGKPKLAKKGWR